MSNIGSKKSCVIGDSALTVQCAKILIKEGFSIEVVITQDKKVAAWAKENNLPVYDYTSIDMYAVLFDYQLDYLFSIVYLLPIGEDILSLANKLAINYHDALLPQYGGIHSTSWAIINREKSHGVTWHVMSSKVDEGDILVQTSIDITDVETAWSLNFKCYCAAVKTFKVLAEKLKTDSYTLTPQNRSERTYYGKHKKPRNGGIIDFSESAFDIDALVRGLNLGNVVNEIGVAKLNSKELSFVVTQTEVSNHKSCDLPGTITGIGETFIQVATMDYDIKICEISWMNGQSIPINEFVNKLDLSIRHSISKIN